MPGGSYHLERLRMWRSDHTVAVNLRRLPKTLEPILPREYRDMNAVQIAAEVKARIGKKLEELGC